MSGAGDAVITIPFTFAATANVIVRWGAFPVFADIDPDTYNLDASRWQLFLERDCIYDAANQSLVLKCNGRRVRAVIPVHYGGHPCNMDAIKKLATRFESSVIETQPTQSAGNIEPRNVGTLAKRAKISC